MRKIVSIDIGGTAIKYALIDEKGNIIVKNKIDTEAYRGGKSILEKTINIVKEFQKKEEINGVAISTAGIVDVKKGEIFYASTIPDYIGINFKKEIEEQLYLPTEVENDANCAGLAEYISGSLKGVKIGAMIAIGTGIGGAIIINGKILHGFSNSACEVGYMKLNNNNEDFQILGSTSTLIKKVAKQKNELEEYWNGYRIFKEAKKGDEICTKAIDEMIDILGKGIANICCVINPEIITLGGGIMEEKEYLKDKVEMAVNKYLIPTIAKSTTIKFAYHKNDAGILGAFYNFCQHQGIEFEV